MKKKKHKFPKKRHKSIADFWKDFNKEATKRFVVSKKTLKLYRRLQPYKALLQDKKLKQKEIVKALNMNKCLVSRIANNKQNIRVSTLARLMKFHKINDPWLIVNFDRFANKVTKPRKKKPTKPATEKLRRSKKLHIRKK